MSENETEQGEAATTPSSGRNRRKVRVGTVVGDKANKTVTVRVERRVAHPLYGKGVRRTSKYHAHDENNEFKVGDTVRIEETRPLSRTKRWRVVELIERPE
jgi:small subunit ribosomal protein S17